MDASVVMWAVMLSVLLFGVLVASFFGGVVLGMRVGSGGTRSLFGVIRGSSVQAADPEYGYPDTEDSIKASLKKAFGGGWMEDEPAMPANQRVAADQYDDAMKMADRQVQRFLDSTVTGRGPRRARSGEAEDDE